MIQLNKTRGQVLQSSISAFCFFDCTTHYYFALGEALDPGDSATFEFTWDSRNKKSYTWKATVTPTDNDSDTDNNTLTKEVIVVRAVE